MIYAVDTVSFAVPDGFADVTAYEFTSSDGSEQLIVRLIVQQRPVEGDYPLAQQATELANLAGMGPGIDPPGPLFSLGTREGLAGVTGQGMRWRREVVGPNRQRIWSVAVLDPAPERQPPGAQAVRLLVEHTSEQTAQPHHTTPGAESSNPSVSSGPGRHDDLNALIVRLRGIGIDATAPVPDGCLRRQVGPVLWDLPGRGFPPRRLISL